MTPAKSMGECAHEGGEAFRTHGVTGEQRHSYLLGSVERVGFLSGFSEAQHAAHTHALAESLVYHQLSVRDNAIDRAWSEKLTRARRAG